MILAGEGNYAQEVILDREVKVLKKLNGESGTEQVVLETISVRKEGGVLFAEIVSPPMNLLLGPELVRDQVSLIQQAEADDTVQVLVFKSADPDYFIAHGDVTWISEYREAAARLTGELSLAMLFRHLSASRLVTIAQIEGRVRGAGSEFVTRRASQPASHHAPSDA